MIAVLATITMSMTEPLIPALLQPLLDRGFQQRSLAVWMVPVALILLFGVRGLAGFIAQIQKKYRSQLATLVRRPVFFQSRVRSDAGDLQSGA